MAAGLGASWHAIGPTTFWYGDLIQRDNRTCRGSAFGGNPPSHKTEAWRDLREHFEWLGLSFVRVEIDARMYEPEREQFSWHNEEMQALYSILDTCQANAADVFFTQMWQDVAWNSHPGICRLQSSPRSVADFANGLATLLEHLIKTKGYSCIRWIAVSNEPGFGSCWWLGPDGKPDSIMPAVRALRAELDRRGLSDLAISGPDTHGLDWAGMEPHDPAIGALSLHAYEGEVPKKFDELVAIDRPGVPRFISEFGHFFMADYRGQNFPLGGPESEAPHSWSAQLLNAEKILTGLNAGIDGMIRWSFANRGDLDGGWQLVRTWDPVRWEYLDRVVPESTAYFGFGVITRFAAKHSSILEIESLGGNKGRSGSSISTKRGEKILATALRSPAGELTIFLLNLESEDVTAVVELSGAAAAWPTRPLWIYQVTEAAVRRSDFKLQPSAASYLNESANKISVVLPARSITTCSTIKRLPEESANIRS
ncbi:MAG TPA: hypothetical protein VFT72_04590 [Opitutaceae bacterium]|nr:hypothetical protein [Opitutaceae bacterium]